MKWRAEESEERANVVDDDGSTSSIGKVSAPRREDVGASPALERDEGGMWRRSHSECPAMCICNMLLSSLCHAELLKADWPGRDGWVGFGQPGRKFVQKPKCVTFNLPGFKCFII